MKKFQKFGYYAITAAVAGITITTPAFAAVDLTGFAVDLTTVEAMAATILTALGGIWAIRKLIKTINRS